MSATPSIGPERRDSRFSRRRFLEAAWKLPFLVSGAAVLGGIVRFLSFETEAPAPTRFALGPASQIEVGSLAAFPAARVVIFRDALGYFARSTLCPHLGCTVEPLSQGFQCPCHGSRFGPQGQLVNGPAPKALRAVQLELDESGALVVDTAIEVALDVRLAGNA
jgi:nitrite reductase/ring-hydroxylating ferredoxin subunit